MDNALDISKKNPRSGASNGVRKIVQVGDTTLRRSASAIPLRDIESAPIKKLITDLKTLLAREEYGVAIAAPQVGEPLRLFIVSGRAAQKRKRSNAKRKRAEGDASALEELPVDDEVYINPELVKISRRKKDKHEGCLSVRGKWGMVPRAEKASVRAYNERGQEFTRGASGLLAQIFQHELDHLDGILYIDKATELFDDADTEQETSSASDRV